MKLGEIIVERELTALVDGKSRKVTVKIGKPVAMPYRNNPRNHYRCAYQIVGIGRGAVYGICGLDSMQALILTLQIVGLELKLKQEEFDLTWEGEKKLGFPPMRIRKKP